MSADAHGGLYKGYTLFNYLPKFNGENAWIPGLDPFTELESWHGAPMATLWRAFNILGSPLVMHPNQLKKDLRELQDLYQERITADDLDELGDAEVGDNTERSNELEGSPGEDAPNSQTLDGSAPNRAESSDMPGTASSDAPNPGGGYILIRNARDSSAVDSAVEISSDTSQQPQKTTQFASNARQ